MLPAGSLDPPTGTGRSARSGRICTDPLLDAAQQQVNGELA
jgi:hypothetical protein